MDESKIYVCRCENLTLKQLHDMMDAGVCSVEEMKRYTRCTKGRCQGKTCKEMIVKEMARYLNKRVEEMDVPLERTPLTPISIGELAGGAEE